MFDLSPLKLLVLAVLAVVVFGPDQLPRIASQAGRALRELRRLADGATADLREGLGPEFSEFDVTDLHPRNFVRKHLLDGLDGDQSATDGQAADGTPVDALSADGLAAGDTRGQAVATLAPGENPPYDAEAT